MMLKKEDLLIRFFENNKKSAIDPDMVKFQEDGGYLTHAHTVTYKITGSVDPSTTVSTHKVDEEITIKDIPLKKLLEMTDNEKN